MVSYAILVVQFLCLSLWIGGSVLVLFVVGPEIFRSEDSSSRPELTMTRILLRFNSGFLISALVLAATLYLQLTVLSTTLGLKLRIALSLVMLAVLLGTYVRFSLAPWVRRRGADDDQGTNKPGRGALERFRKLHGRSLGLLMVNLFLGIGVVITLILPM